MSRFSIGKNKNRKHQRRAAAVVEMAVVLPVLLTILFGIIEFGWTFMVYQNMTNAAREGCRIAALEGSTESDISARVSKYMTLVGLSNYQLTIQRATATDPTETVTIKVPYSSVSLLGGYFGPRSYDLSSKACMRKEGAE